MAIVHTATVLDARPIGAAGRHLALALRPGADGPLGFVGGQYVIVDSGLTLPNGRAAKRAYSMISSDIEQATCEVIVKRHAGELGGVVSSFLHSVEVGASFHFSGPWGKYVAAEPAGRTLVLATDTGITAALGLLAGRAFAGRAPATDLIWLADDSFVPEAFVADRVRDRCASLRVLRPAGDRIAAAVEAALAVTDGVGAVYLSGDGDVLYAVRAALLDCGVAEGAFRIESFFNVPKVDRKVP
jgi:ferredoxin-NADP reductase